MKHVYVALAWLVCTGAGWAQLAGDVSGTWPAGSHQTVVGDIEIPKGETLVIEPGVTVAFEGPYELLVLGELSAVGTAAAPIRFTRAQPTEASRWRGIYFDGADDASVLEHCQVEWVKKQGTEGKGSVRIEWCSPTIRLCELNDNLTDLGGGIHVGRTSTSVIELNHIHHNQSGSGGGVSVWGLTGPVFIQHNLIESNTAYSGGGISTIASTVHIRGNYVIDNLATTSINGGGGLMLWDTAFVYGNVIARNAAPSGRGGGGIYVQLAEQPMLFLHNTIVDNSAERGGGIFLGQGSYAPPIDGCILWGNTASAEGDAIYAYPGYGIPPQVIRSNVQGGWPGQNLSVDPRFVDHAGGDYHLRPDSPLRDRAAATRPDAFPFDIDREPRLWGPRMDIGADEVAPTRRGR